VAYGLLGAAVAAHYNATVMAQARALLLNDKPKTASSEGTSSKAAANIKGE